MKTEKHKKAPVESQEQIIDRLLSHRADLKRLGIARIGIFGSFSRKQQNPESDIDLLVDFLPGQKNFRRFMDASFPLEELLGRKVELITRESLSIRAAERILKEVENVPLSE